MTLEELEQFVQGRFRSMENVILKCISEHKEPERYVYGKRSAFLEVLNKLKEVKYAQGLQEPDVR